MTGERKYSILLVEDEAIIALDLSSTLERIGYAVAGTATTGEEGLEMTLALNPDLVIMDILLGAGMDGIETAAAIRKRRDIPVVYMTANADAATVERARSTEPFGYINKPVSENDLRTGLDTALYKHRMEKALRESEERYKRIVEMATEGIWAMDGRRVTTFVNRRMEEMLGYGSGEMIGKRVTDFMFPEDIPDHEERMRRRSAGEGGRYEQRFRRTDGGACWCIVSATALMNPDGTFGGSFAMFTDITERKKSEEARRESEERFWQLFDNMADGVAIYRPVNNGEDFEFVDINRSGQILSQVFREEVTGQRLTEKFPAVEEMGLLDLLRRVLRTGKPEELPLVHYADGRVSQWVENYVFRIPSGLVVALYKDVSHQHMIDEARRESEEKFRSLFENMAQGVVCQGRDGRITDCNPAAERILGLTRGQILGRDSLDPQWKTIHEDGSDFPGREHPSMISFRTGAPVLSVIMGVYHPAREEYCWILVSAFPRFREGAAEPFEVVTTFEDITGRMLLEEKIRESENRFREFFMREPSYCYLVSPEGLIMDLNPAALEILGYEAREDLIGRPLIDTVYAPSSRERARDLFTKWEETGVFENEELSIVTREGRERRVLLSVTGVRDDQGRLLHSVSLQRDITELRRAEEELRRDRSQLTRAEGIARIGYWEFDYRSGLVKASEGARSVYGLGDADWSIERVREVPLPEYRSLLDEAMKGLLEEGRDYDVRFKIRRPSDGKTADIHSRAEYDPARGMVFGVIRDISGETLREEKLAAARRELEEARDLADLGVWSYDVEKGEVRWSGKVYEICGLDPASPPPTYADHGKLFMPEDVDLYRKDVRQALEQGTPYSHELRVQRPDGAVRYMIGRGQGVIDAEGRVTRLYGTVQDVTERRLMEQALRESEEKFRSYIEHAPLGFFVADRNGRYREVNRRACALLGYSEKELLAMSIGDFIAPASREEGMRHFQRVAEEGFASGEFEFLRKDGSSLWMRVDAASLGKDRFIAFCLDVTERKRIEQRIREREDLFSVIFQIGPDPMAITHMETGHVFNINKAFEIWSGYSREEIVGRATLELDLWVSDGERDQCLDQLRSRGEVDDFPCRIRIKSGDVREVQFSARFIHMDGVDYLLTRAHDVTLQVYLERALQSSEENIRNLFANVPVGMFQSTPEGKFVYVNGAVAAMLGYDSAAELIERVNNSSIAEALYEDPARRPLLVREVEEQEGGWKVFENRYRRRDGGVIDAVLTFCARQDPMSGVTYLYGFVQDVTERKRMDQALKDVMTELQRSRDFLRVLLNSLPSPVFFKDAEGRYLGANEAFCRFLGFSEEDLIGKTVFDLDTEEDLARHYDEHDRALRDQGTLQMYQSRVKAADGSLRDVIFHKAVFSNPDGSYGGIVGTITDITERIRDEEALKNREKLLEKILDILPIGLWLADREGRLIRGNPAGVRIWGAEPRVSLEEYGVFRARRLPSREEIAPEDWALAHTVQEGITVQDELLEIDAFDGKKRIILNYTAPVTDDEGRVQGAIVVNQDMTALTRMQEALVESEERYREYVTRFQGIAFMRRKDFTSVFLHGAVEEITGYPEEELLAGAPRWFELVYEEDFPAFFVQSERLRALAHYSCQRDYRIVRKDGSLRWIREMVRNICDETGAPTHMEGALYDITELKEAEEALRNSLKEKETLLREVHHRVKNNLQIILSLLRMQSRKIKERALADILADGQSRIYTMALIHERLYQSEDYSRINFAEYVRLLAAELTKTYEPRGGAVILEFQAEELYLDIQRAVPCGLVLNELITNALKHAFPEGWAGERKIMISLKKDRAGNIEIIVADTGAGAATEAESPEEDGMGLGLVRSIVERQLEGTFEQEMRGGMVFRMILAPEGA